MIEIVGTVVKGKKRGATLGFPTANILLDTKLPEGIYISLTSIDFKEYPSITFIGKAITYDEAIFQVETYLLDFNSNLYRKKITVRLLKKIRGNKKFASEEALVKQMKHDKMQAEAYFKAKAQKSKSK